MNPPIPGTKEATEQRTSPEPPELEDPRLVQAVQEYFDTLESGRRPDRQEFLDRHPEIASPLSECLDAMEFVHQVSPRLEGSGSGRAGEPSPPTPTDLAVPLGDFRILREIGRGGMGVVYEAEQLSLGRRIALKVLPFALTLDSRQLQRFKNEARAAAQLHHTNIVPIYSVGCERGVHFYAMQFVEGQSLASVVRELRHLAGLETAAGAGPGSGSSPTARHGRQDSQPTGPYVPAPSGSSASAALATSAGGGTARSTRSAAFFRSTARLGVQAAEALEHAHGMGVVHRDIKPGNLLVDVNSHLWVTDFGLAQFQSDAALTVSGDVVGTLRYMSPEQALAKRKLVDHRTDIYSLGATLYELLTLEPPFRGRDREELLRQITFEEPRPPRRVNPAIPVDLETIVLKALAKAPEERYATAQEFADDLRRFLEDRPILARRPTLVEKAAKWSKRHRPVVALGVMLLVLAAAGLVTTTVLIAQEEARTKAAYQAEAQQRGLAEASFRQAREAVDFLTQVTEEELADKPELRGVRRKMLDAALHYYREFINLRGDDPALRAELAESLQRVGTILQELDRRGEALVAMKQAQNIQETLVRTQPTNEQKRRLADININLDWLQGGAQLFLLSQEAVQNDLELDEEQRDTLKKLGERRSAALRSQHEFTKEEWNRRLADQERALATLLREEQVQRVRQIVLQKQGPRAFSEPEVEETLQLTARQKNEIRKTLADAGLGEMGTPRPPPARRLDPERAREKILSVLTEEQKGQWSAMIGEPLTYEVYLGPPRPGGPGGHHHGPPKGRP